MILLIDLLILTHSSNFEQPVDVTDLITFRQLARSISACNPHPLLITIALQFASIALKTSLDFN